MLAVKKQLKLTVNEEVYEVAVKPKTTLVQLLRNELGLTGAKIGCDVGICGACTVLLDGKAVKACSILALQADGKKVTTIEALAKRGELHPIQKAFVEHGAVQCGFCTPGMIMSAKALLDENPKPTEGEIKEAIAGNLCRCTGYTKILKAISSVAQPSQIGGRK